MRKLALSLVAAGVLVCGTLSRPASAGDTHMPGAEPTPEPTPCPDCFSPEGNGTNSATAVDGSFVIDLVDGVLLIVSLRP